MGPLGEEAAFLLTDHVAPQPDFWRLQPPAPGSRQPLKVFLDKHLDHVMLGSCLKVCKR